MCGIVGAVSERDVVKLLLEGLTRLEYRGYDSAGLAVLNGAQDLERVRCDGKVQKLIQASLEKKTQGHIGIAHTRWATTELRAKKNAHPHTSRDAIAIVHNGIIENHETLRKELAQQGYVFVSDTDSEVIAHLFHAEWTKTQEPIAATQCLLEKLEGAFAVAIVLKATPQRCMPYEKEVLLSLV